MDGRTDGQFISEKKKEKKKTAYAHFKVSNGHETGDSPVNVHLTGNKQ